MKRTAFCLISYKRIGRFLSSLMVTALWCLDCSAICPQNSDDHQDSKLNVESDQAVVFESSSEDWSARITGVKAPVNVTWALSRNNQVLHQGVRKTSARDPGRLSLPIQWPELRSKDALDLEMTLLIHPATAPKRQSPYRFPVTIIPDNHLQDQLAPLESSVHVWDRHQTTWNSLTSLGVQFQRVTNLTDAEFKSGDLLIVGAGTDWNRKRIVQSEIPKLIEKGVHVLILGPANLKLSLDSTYLRKVQLGPVELPQGRRFALDLDSSTSANLSRIATSKIKNNFELNSSPNGLWSYAQLWWGKRESLHDATQIVIVGPSFVSNVKQSAANQYYFANLVKQILVKGESNDSK